MITSTQDQIAVVIPCYRERRHILDVIRYIGELVSSIYVVDDACPDQTGAYVEANNTDPRVKVLYHSENRGVGAATVTGYRQAMKDGADIIIKIDGDGQMDPRDIPKFVYPIQRGYADYTKGNRFYDLRYIHRMPVSRMIGNAGLSFMTKLSSGYWDIFDPTNGYTAIHAAVLQEISLDLVDERFLFETDMLFRLNIVRAKVVDVPLHARYEDEVSHLNVLASIPRFFGRNVKNLAKRIVYSYFIRDFSVSSIQLVLGVMLFLFGLAFGLSKWHQYLELGEQAPTGTIMIPTICFITGIQMILGFISFDVSSTPRQATYPTLQRVGV
jgi:dolichol-phosphate mannosyltransferase